MHVGVALKLSPATASGMRGLLLSCLYLSIGWCMAAVSIWQRFVTIHQEDQDLLVQEAKKWRFRPIISNYQGNTQTVITHPKGDARQFARSAFVGRKPTVSQL